MRIRTVYRVMFSHKNMLEWVTAADTEARSKNSTGSYYRKMWFTIPASALTLLSLVFVPDRSPIPAATAAVAWLVAPLVAHLISRPMVRKPDRLADNDLAMLRKLSRRTWRFFEDFSTAEDNYLPPDNIQLDPPRGTAHRTSPTNIGMLLLSVLSARDMGYTGAYGMAERVNNIIGTLEKMKNWKGHLYNWYDMPGLWKSSDPNTFPRWTAAIWSATSWCSRRYGGVPGQKAALQGDERIA